VGARGVDGCGLPGAAGRTHRARRLPRDARPPLSTRTGCATTSRWTLRGSFHQYAREESAPRSAPWASGAFRGASLSRSACC
jgi:hypothetical protein